MSSEMPSYAGGPLPSPNGAVAQQFCFPPTSASLLPPPPDPPQSAATLRPTAQTQSPQQSTPLRISTYDRDRRPLNPRGQEQFGYQFENQYQYQRQQEQQQQTPDQRHRQQHSQQTHGSHQTLTSPTVASAGDGPPPPPTADRDLLWERARDSSLPLRAQFSLLAEAAGRAQEAVLMRDMKDLGL